MDARFRSQGFAVNPVSDMFKNLGNSIHVGGAGSAAGCDADTTLRLDSPGSLFSDALSASKGIKRKRSLFGASLEQKIGLPLCLGLGRSSSSSDSKGSSATACTTMSSAKETDEESSMDLELDLSLHLGNEKTPSPKNSANSTVTALDLRVKVDLELSLSFGPAKSNLTTHPSSVPPQNVVKKPLILGRPYHKDEGSMSSHWKRGNSFSPLQHPSEVNSFLNQALREHKAAPITPDLSSSVITTPKSSVTCTSGITQQQQQRSSSAKACQFH